MRRARRETLLAVAFERKLVLPLLCPIHTAPTTLLIRLLLASHPPSPLGKAKISLRYGRFFSRFFISPPHVAPHLPSCHPRAKRRISMGDAIISRAALLENDTRKIGVRKQCSPAASVGSFGDKSFLLPKGRRGADPYNNCAFVLCLLKQATYSLSNIY